MGFGWLSHISLPCVLKTMVLFLYAIPPLGILAADMTTSFTEHSPLVQGNVSPQLVSLPRGWHMARNWLKQSWKACSHSISEQHFRASQLLEWWSFRVQPLCRCFFICSVLPSSFPFRVNTWKHLSVNLLHTCGHLRICFYKIQAKTLGENECENYTMRECCFLRAENPLLWCSLRTDIGLWIGRVEIRGYCIAVQMVSYASLPCGS